MGAAERSAAVCFVVSAVFFTKKGGLPGFDCRIAAAFGDDADNQSAHS